MVVQLRVLLHGLMMGRMRGDERPRRFGTRAARHAAAAADRCQLVRRRRTRARPEKRNTY